MKKKKKSRETFGNKFWRNPFVYLLLLYMVIKGGYKIYNNYRLEKDGFCMEAVTYMGRTATER